MDAGVEVELIAPLGFRVFDEPVEESAAVAFRAVAAFGDEIIDVEKLAPRETFGDSKACDGFDLAVDQAG